DFRSYRRPSRRAQEGALIPLLRDVGTRMGLEFVPKLRIFDSPVLGVWTHTRHIVLSKGLIDQMDEDEMAAVMAHELTHWVRGDQLAARFVWGCALPLVLLANLYTYVFLRMSSAKRFGTLALILVWPALTLLRFFVQPLMVARGR